MQRTEGIFGSGTSSISGGASISDVLTALKNLVQAVNNASRAYLNVNGVSMQANISATTLVKSGSGRIAAVSVTVAGGALGSLYDSASIGTLVNKVWVIPNVVGFYSVPLPLNYGLVVVPGSGGQIVAVSWS